MPELATIIEKARPELPVGQADERDRALLRRRSLADRLARRMVRFGGIAIIISILAILFVILAVIYPLFKKPSVDLAGTVALPAEYGQPLTLGVDEYRQVAYVVFPSGVQFVSLEKKSPLSFVPFPGLNGARAGGVAKARGDLLMLGLSDGRVLPARVRFDVSYQENARTVVPELETLEPLVLDAQGGPATVLAAASTDRGYSVAGATGQNKVSWISREERKNLMGGVSVKERRKDFVLPAKGGITALAMDDKGIHILAGTASGQILRVEVGDSDGARDGVETVGATSQPGVGVSALGFLIGFETLVVGDELGEVNSYQLFKGEDERVRMMRVRNFTGHEKPVTAVFASPRDKGFLTGDAEGVVRYHFGTSGETRYAIRAPGEGGLVSTLLTPKVDGLMTADRSGRVSWWTVDNPHPEISWDTLFGKVLYEGYPEPEYVWQSSSGSDAFEPKFSLVPLIVGTLKGTFYALLFAIPLALFGAFYTSQFTHPAYKNVVKPVIEVMAALPSVVLGFFAALWLAPQVEKVLPGLAVFPFVMAVLVFAALLVCQRSPALAGKIKRPGSEIWVLIAVAIGAGGIAFYLGEVLEGAMLGGDYRLWLNGVLGLSYDQRNSLVVGLAMGFAVIPIIFTIAEDSLSNVPTHLAAASLALGATRWQTAVNVVLPTASPGIFSAIMIGFGRAVGETMIVLMATGNTPVMNWNVFSGFRALSANIAVELPEAPDGSTHFRILFLAAFILFVMTFLVNSVAEWVRLRLRERYRTL
ncbi:MAG: ABC transporter permease subunit [Nitrospinae bacterium]|nr:ABC transporter permease subunit [Nitrospinota bacterium]